MFKIKYYIYFLLGVLFLSSCSSMTAISSIPAGAKVYINDEYKGVTPYVYQDTKLAFSKIAIKLKKMDIKILIQQFLKMKRQM